MIVAENLKSHKVILITTEFLEDISFLNYENTRAVNSSIEIIVLRNDRHLLVTQKQLYRSKFCRRRR
jgi:hypothetical protein